MRSTIDADRLDALTRAYERFVPREFLALLGKRDATELALGDQTERRMSVLFSDIRDFTTLSEAMSPKQNFAFINTYLSRMAPVIAVHGGIVDKYVGDAIMALFPDARAAVRSALAMLAELDILNGERQTHPIHIGLGINTGVLMLGIVGAAERIEGTVISDAVNLASRLENETKTYRVPVLISEHTLYALGEDHGFCTRFVDRTRVKGKHQPESLYEVFDHDDPDAREAKLASLPVFEEAVAYYHLREVVPAKAMFERCLDANPADHVAGVYLGRCEDYLATGRHTGTGELDETVVWRDEYAIGVPEIDDQHRTLFDHIDKAFAAIKNGDLDTINELMTFVGDYAKGHFASEEKLMEQVGYPFAADQIAEHKLFLSQFGTLKEQINATIHKRLFLQFQVQLFLVDWVVNHTIKRDGHIGRWIRQKHDG